jgi:enoyl-CoA hydratase/carnithine racemase
MTEITTSMQGQTLVLKFNRPEKMNAITRGMYGELAQQLNAAAENPEIRCVVITSEGDHFTAGNDIRDFMSNPPTEEDSTVAKFLGSILEFPKPLLAAVKGNAVGVGTTLLLHCDVVVAAPDAKFSMPFTSLGLVPEAGSTKLFPDLVGYQRAAKIFMTGDPFSAEEALSMGLVAQLANDPVREISEIAEKIANQPPKAIMNTKALMKANSHDAVAHVMRAEFQLFALALQSEEAAEAFMKFMSSRGK